MKIRCIHYLVLIATFWVTPLSVLGDAKSVFEEKCTACHGFGVTGAPKLGDKADWAPRIAQGRSILYGNAINGFSGRTGVMPPKGGFTDLSDEEIKLIVDFMVAQSK